MNQFLLICADLIAVVVLVYVLYFPRYRRRDMVVAILGINVGVLAVATVLSSAEVTVGLGLGLFGVLSIIRLRSQELDQEEVVYYFSALALGLAVLAHHSVSKSASTLAFVAITLAALFAVMNLDELHSTALQVADNIVLVITGIWLIVQGIREGVTHYFYLGVFTVMLTGLLRYIDLVGDYIGAAILFAVFAVILLVSARYWKKHVASTEAAS